MQYTILLDRHENTKLVEAQEQSRFIYSIIEAIGIQIEWNPDEELSIDEKIRLYSEFDKYNIAVIDDNDGNIKVYAENELKGQWHKCKYKLKSDMSKPDPKKRLYMEMLVSFDAFYEKEQDE